MVNTYINIINLKDDKNNNKNTEKFLLKVGIKLFVLSTLYITTCAPVHLPLAKSLLADIGELSPVMLHDLTDHPPHPTVLGEDGVVVLGQGDGPLTRIIDNFDRRYEGFDLLEVRV